MTEVSTPPSVDEGSRAAALLDAQAKAELLFNEVELGGLIRPGQSEQAVSAAIYDLALNLFGVRKHWHKRIVRSGPNTLLIYKEKLQDRVITGDDIVFLDLGPIFEEWEADFGRTFVLGEDPKKLKLRDDLAPAFAKGKEYFQSHPEITGAELYEYVASMAADCGWEYGGLSAGHMVGEFPHEGLRPGEEGRWITPGNTTPLRGVDANGRQLHWILEIHFVDRGLSIGGFYEQLLTL